MLNYNTIAGKFPSTPSLVFFIIIIIIISSSLVSSEDLLDVSLLNSYMDVILGASRKQVIALTCSAKALKEVLLDTG